MRDRFRPLSTTQPSRALCSPPFPSPSCAALVRGLRDSTATRRRSRRPRIQHLALRGGLQDRLRHFTPPQILRTLDTFPSDQGKFRVSFLVTTAGGGSTLLSLGLKKQLATSFSLSRTRHSFSNLARSVSSYFPHFPTFLAFYDPSVTFSEHFQLFPSFPNIPSRFLTPPARPRQLRLATLHVRTLKLHSLRFPL